MEDLFALPVFRKYTFFEFPKNNTEGIFASFPKRIASQVPYEKLWASDGRRKKLSKDPEHVYKKHPEGETVEDYQSVISTTKWNSKDWADRNPMNRILTQDASINPISSKLRD